MQMVCAEIPFSPELHARRSLEPACLPKTDDDPLVQCMRRRAHTVLPDLTPLCREFAPVRRFKKTYT
jgi:hypothetical protein